MSDVRDFCVHDTLRDGTAIAIRAARPDDRPRIAEAFRALDREAVYTRFFSYKRELSERELDVLDTLDFDRDIMLVATTTGSDGAEAIVASARSIGRDVAGNGRVAEIAFTVVDAFRGRGIATRLLRELVALARRTGVVEFEADVLAGNAAMLAVFRRSGLAPRETRDGGVVHVTMALPPA